MPPISPQVPPLTMEVRRQRILLHMEAATPWSCIIPTDRRKPNREFQAKSSFKVGWSIPECSCLPNAIRCFSLQRSTPDAISLVHIVTLPEGVKPGDTIHVQSPSGKINAIVVPSGFGPGSTFTVEFATNEETAPVSGKPETAAPSNHNYPSSTPVSASPHQDGDGFAAGFNNPDWRPTTAAVVVDEPEIAVQSDNLYGSDNYPSATATPVYIPQFTSPPSYPSK